MWDLMFHSPSLANFIFGRVLNQNNIAMILHFEVSSSYPLAMLSCRWMPFIIFLNGSFLGENWSNIDFC